MIESAAYVYEKTIKPVLLDYDRYKESKNNVIYTEQYRSDIKRLNNIVISARNLINNFKYTGDVLEYMNQLSSTNTTRDLFRKYGYHPFEDVIDDFKVKFKNELDERCSVNELIVNQIYSTWDFILLAGFYSARTPGILPVKNKNNAVIDAVVARGKFKGDQNYANAFLDNGDALYYLIDGKHKYNDFILNDRVPVFLFETVSSNRQKFLGKFSCREVRNDNSVVLVEDHYVEINVPEIDPVHKQAVPLIEGRKRFKKFTGRSNSGSNLTNQRKQQSGQKAESIVEELLTRKNIIYKNVANDTKYNFDILIEDQIAKMGLEIKNISNSIFYLSFTEIQEFINGKTRICFVGNNHDSKTVFISKEYNETKVLKKVCLDLQIIKDKVIDDYEGKYSVSDIEIAITDDDENNMNNDFIYVGDLSQQEILEFLQNIIV